MSSTCFGLFSTIGFERQVKMCALARSEHAEFDRNEGLPSPWFGALLRG
jgi:hypothetical protein